MLQTHLDKGRDLLEEAEMLSQGGPFDQVTGIKEIARELRCRMKHFKANLEEIRDKVEDTDRCYQLLDKVGGGGVLANL